jgi:hypothetical protein
VVFRLRVLAIGVAMSANVAEAGGLVVVTGSPRGIGRAGTGTVGDDGGGALLVNPAAMARREAMRLQLGISSVDDSIAWQSDNAGAPAARDQAGSHVMPIGAFEGAIGGWVIGVAAMTSAVGERSFRRPGDIPPDDFGVVFDYRYAGIHSFTRRDTVALGAARRLGENVAIGVAVAGSHVKLAETRRIWAGFGGRDPLGDPQHDVELELGGTDVLSPSAVAGILVAPADTPIELGASVGWTAHTRFSGDAIAFGTKGGPSTLNTNPTASLDLAQPWTLRGGVRYAGERIVAEMDGDVWLAPAAGASSTWKVSGIHIVDPSGVAVDLDSVPSRISLRTHSALRASTDVELIDGFLWATTGYAYTTSSTPPDRLSPTFGELPGHTFALGLETTAGGFTVTLGWSRTWWPQTHAQASQLALDNPFLAGDRNVVAGSYGGSSDQVGIVIDAELDAPAP